MTVGRVRVSVQGQTYEGSAEQLRRLADNLVRSEDEWCQRRGKALLFALDAEEAHAVANRLYAAAEGDKR